MYITAVSRRTNRTLLLKKIYNSSDMDIIKDINKGRVKVGFPSCEPSTNLLLDKNLIQKYILLRLRIEEPELWTKENISDDDLPGYNEVYPTFPKT